MSGFFGFSFRSACSLFPKFLVIHALSLAHVIRHVSQHVAHTPAANSQKKGERAMAGRYRHKCTCKSLFTGKSFCCNTEHPVGVSTGMIP